MKKEELEQHLADLAGQFPGLVLFVADPETDAIALSYQDKIIAKRIVSKTGDNEQVIHTALSFFNKKSRGARGQMNLMFATMVFNMGKMISEDARALSQLLPGKKGRAKSTV